MKAAQWAWAVVACQTFRAALALAEGAAPEAAPPRLRDVEPCLVRVVGVFEGKQRAAGTGFLVSREGHIVTCSKGIERAEEVRVSGPALGEGLLKAREMDSNPGAGVSLLKVDALDGTPCVKVRDAVFFTPGDFAYALGLGEGGAQWAAGCTRAMMLGVRSFPNRGRLIQFDRAFPETFLGAPVLTGGGTAVGVITFEPEQGPSHAGWGVPMDADAVRNLLILNHVPYQAKYSLWEYATWPFFLSFILVAVLIYGGYVAVLWRSRGREAALSRLPARTVALCVLASALAHLSVFVAVLMLQQHVEEGEGGPDLTEVAVVNTDTEGAGGLPGDRAQPIGGPPKVDQLPTRPAPEPVDVNKKIRQVAEEKIKDVAKEAAKADEDSRLLTQKELEGAVALAQERARKTRRAAEDLEANTKSLIKRLGEGGGDGGSGGGGGGAGGGKEAGPGGKAGRKGPRTGGVDSPEARRARWTIVIGSGLKYLEFVDKHGGEIATYSAADPETLFYVSAVTSEHKRTRTGPVSAEKRIWWSPESPYMFRREPIALFLEVGREVGPGDPIISFYPPAFEDKLARLEKAFRAVTGLRGAPTRTVFNVGWDLEPTVAYSQ